MTATPKFMLGTYVFDPNAADPAAEAWFENQFNTFTAAMGTRPLYMNAFTNYYADWSQWVPIQNALAKSWASSPVLGGVTPVMTIPMATGADWNNADQVYKDIVAGKHDDVFVGLINSWKNVGYATVDARIGPEMNGTFEPWFMGNDPATVADWTKAFQHIADLVHSVPGIAVRTVWNPADLNYTAQPTSSAYPGDKYVDVLGVDVYSAMYPGSLYDWHKNDGTYDANLQTWFADPVNREHYWANPNATEYNPNGYDPSQWGMKQVLAFANAHNKPLGIAETGAGGNGTSTGPVDDPDFPKWLYSVLSLPGGPKVDYVNIWDINPGDGNWQFTDGTKPLEAAAWKQYFGVPSAASQAGAVPTPPTVGTGPDTLVLAMAEDAYQGDAQFTVSLDGTQLGGVLATQALHSLGQSQNFTFNGTWGAAGPHVVTVSFLNDAWGGSASLDRNLYVGAVTFDGAAQQANVEQGSAGSLNFGVGTAATSAAFADFSNTRFVTAIKPGNTTQFGNWVTGLKTNIYQWSSGGVTGIGAASFDTVQSLTLTDGSGGSFALNNFDETNVNLSGAPTAAGSASTIWIDNAMRGSLAFGSGNYNMNINVLSAFADAPYNIFRISTGSGTDAVTINGDAGRTAAAVNLGSGLAGMSFINVLNATVTGGSGAATVMFGSGSGTGTITAGSGILDVTGGAGADTYAVHAGVGIMMVENFSLAKGDTLQVDKALQASLAEQQQASGVMLSFNGDATHGVLLKGLTTLAPTSISWV